MEGSSLKRYITRHARLLITLLIIAALLLAAAMALLWYSRQQEAANGITSQIRGYSGLVRTVTDPEYEFFETLALRNLENREDAALLDAETRQLVAETSAQFYLGAKLELCQPYSFEAMQLAMEQENTRRELTVAQGGVIYGPTGFDLMGYYQYISSNLRAEIISYIASHADRALEALARDYFETQRATYDHPETIRYSMTQDSTTEERTVAWQELRSLGMTEPMLADRLIRAKPDEEFICPDGAGQERTVKIISIQYIQTDFESKKGVIIEDFLNGGYYDELLQTVAEQNPVEFDLQRS